MSLGILLVGVFLIVVIVGVVVIVRLLTKKGRDDLGPGGTGFDLVPYLLLAVAMGVSIYSVARLGRAAFPGANLVGSSTQQVASALAGLVVGVPFAVFLWNRQAGRRELYPASPGWPLYLSVVEAVLTTTLVVVVIQLLLWLAGDSGRSSWTDVIVIGAAVALHEWAARRDPPGGDAADLPRVVGSAIGLITASIGLTGLLWSLLESIIGTVQPVIVDTDVTNFVIILVVGLPLWAYRWLIRWDTPPEMPRKAWSVLVSVVALATAIGAALAAAVEIFDYSTNGGDISTGLASLPGEVAVTLVALGIWIHHRGRLDKWWSGSGAGGRNAVLAAYQYSMIALGLAFSIGSLTALTAFALGPDRLLSDSGEAMVALALTALTSLGVWSGLWWKVQAEPREIEASIQPRRAYLIGMAIVVGLTAAQAVIAVLVVLFQGLLGLDVSQLTLVTEGTLAILAGGATTHLLLVNRADRALGESEEVVSPFTVTIICSHPGTLTALFPKQATTRVIYRSDDLGVIDEAMAGQILAEVGSRSSLVWVDGDGYRVTAAR